MSLQALRFAKETDDFHLYGDARLTIFSLLKEIHEVYEHHIKRPSGKTCDICGRGDTNEALKVGRILAGYKHRPHKSPCLCHNHACGWTLSYSRLDSTRRANLFCEGGVSQVDVTTYSHTPVISDKETDLHFVHYLATQLLKAKHETNQPSQPA